MWQQPVRTENARRDLPAGVLFSHYEFLVDVLLLVSCVRKKCNDTCPLYSCSDLSLVLGACTCDSSREDLASLCHEVLQSVDVFIVDDDRLVGTELAYLASSHATHMSSVFHIHYLPFLTRSLCAPEASVCLRTARPHRSLRKNPAYHRPAEGPASVEQVPAAAGSAVQHIRPDCSGCIRPGCIRPDH